MTVRIVGLTGPIGVGKTTVANYLVSQYGAKQLAFADPIKEIAATVLNTSVDRLTDDIKNVPMDILGGRTPRQFYQMVGTDWFVETFGKDFWIKHLERRLRIAQLTGQGLFVVSDVRNVKENAEADWLRSVGGHLIHLDGPSRRDPGGKHRSNTPVDFHPATDTWVANTGSIKALFDQIDAAMIEQKIFKEQRDAQTV